MRVLGIIPARGGSKGIPRKNIASVAGKPLIAYSIEIGIEAKRLGLINELIVSTDDGEIAEISRTYGANVPFIRPESLSNDSAKSVDVMIHAYNFFSCKGVQFDSVLLLQPTTPLRNLDDIRESLSIFKKEKAQSLISCYKEEYICDCVAYHKEGNKAIPLNKNHNKGIRRQELEDIYIRNGSIYITDADYMIRERQVIADTPAIYVMPKERSVNIDTVDDLELLKWVLSK